jgi:drug/metabolite transporter (DMT)-like permease
MKRSSSSLAHALVLSRAILRDRTTRRKWLGAFALSLVVVFGVGTTFLAGWLSESIARFSLYWLGVLGLIVVVILFALYDALAVIREERDRMK